MLEYLWLLWLFSAPVMIYFFIRALQNHRVYEQKIFNYEIESAQRIVFQFCSRNAPQVVFEAIKRVHDVCRLVGYTNYQVDLVTDVKLPREFTLRFNAKCVTVPSDYQTSPPVKYKARALQYAIEQRKKHRGTNPRTYIYLLDEESMVTEQSVRALLQYISNKDAKPIAEGGIIYPNHFLNNNLLCSIGETFRTYVCYDCVTQMSSGKMPIHMHGSNLLVRSDVEAQVGWAYPKVDLSEDQRFGWEATLKLGKGIFGWHGGTIEEQPARSTRDFIEQRQRWFVGSIHNLQNAKISMRQKIGISLRWLSWLTGFPAGLVTFLVLLIPQGIPDLIRIFLAFNTFTWLIGYQVGLRLILKKYPLAKYKVILWHLTTLLLTPLVGIVETFAVFIAPLQLRRAIKRRPTPKYSKELQGEIREPVKEITDFQDEPQLLFETAAPKTVTEQPQRVFIETSAVSKAAETRVTELGGIPPQSVAEMKTVVLEPRLDKAEVRLIGERIKQSLFARFGFKSKAANIQLLTLERYFEPYLVIAGKYNIDYCRKHVCEVAVGETTAAIYFAGQEFRSELSDSNKTGRVVKVIGEEHVHHEKRSYFILDRMNREVHPEKLHFSPFCTHAENLHLNSSFKRISIPEEMQIEFLRTKIAQRPRDADSVIKEVFDITDRMIVYNPVYQLTFKNEKRQKEATVTIDGITGEIILNGTRRFAVKTNPELDVGKETLSKQAILYENVQPEPILDANPIETTDFRRDTTKEEKQPAQPEIEENVTLGLSTDDTDEAFKVDDKVAIVLGDIEVPSGTSVNKTLVVTGNLWIGNNCKVRGNLKALESITLGANSNVDGDVIAGENVLIGAGTIITGRLQARGYIKLDEHTSAKPVIGSDALADMDDSIHFEVNFGSEVASVDHENRKDQA